MSQGFSPGFGSSKGVVPAHNVPASRQLVHLGALLSFLCSVSPSCPLLHLSLPAIATQLCTWPNEVKLHRVSGLPEGLAVE